jgi:hypothetical protein
MVGEPKQAPFASSAQPVGNKLNSRLTCGLRIVGGLMVQPFQDINGDAGSAFSAAKSAKGIDDKTNHKNQADSAPTENRAAIVKSAAAEQQKEDEDDQDQIHAGKITNCDNRFYGVFTL